MQSPQERIANSSCKNAISFSSARTRKRFPSSRWASAIQMVCPTESTAETQPKLQTAFLRLSAKISQLLHRRGPGVCSVISFNIFRKKSGDHTPPVIALGFAKPCVAFALRGPWGLTQYGTSSAHSRILFVESSLRGSRGTPDKRPSLNAVIAAFGRPGSSPARLCRHPQPGMKQSKG